MSDQQRGIVTVDPDGDVAVVRLNRPERRNAVNAALVEAMASCADDAAVHRRHTAAFMQQVGTTPSVLAERRAEVLARSRTQRDVTWAEGRALRPDASRSAADGRLEPSR